MEAQGQEMIRYDLISYFKYLAPEIKILTPIRDSKLTRENEIDFLNQSGIKISWEKAKYSINKGLWGTSVGGDETLTSDLKLPNSAYPGNLKSKSSKEITLTFKNGEICGLMEKNMTQLHALN